ncbi:Crossover junction endonuclease mus81, partial [Rhizophlyctis rosea]
MPPKRKGHCANPLFRDWLWEWWDEAKSSAALGGNTRSQWIYKKAYDGMSKYPLPLESGLDAKVVEGIGDKLAKLLDEKLKRYQSGELAVGASDDIARAVPSRPAPKRRAPAKQRASADTSDDSCGEADGIENAIDLTSDDRPPPSTKRRKTKAYMPRYRSASYALLMALYDEGRCQVGDYCSKQELITRAHPYSDASMDTPAAGQTFGYTGWSCMKKLLERQLIHRFGTPHQFGLTEEGLEVAQTLAQGRKRMEGGDVGSGSEHVAEWDKGGPASQTLSASANSDPSSSTRIMPANDSNIDVDVLTELGNEPEPFKFTYIDGEGAHVRTKDEAAVDIFGNSVGYKIELMGSNVGSLSPGVMKMSNRGDGSSSFYLLDEYAPQASTAKPTSI